MFSYFDTFLGYVAEFKSRISCILCVAGRLVELIVWIRADVCHVTVFTPAVCTCDSVCVRLGDSIDLGLLSVIVWHFYNQLINFTLYLGQHGTSIM